MNIKPISILAACVFFTAGCNKSPTTPTANNNGSQPPPAPIQPEPFHGQVYKPIDGSGSLTLVSQDECEISAGGSIVLCKYTKPNDTLRVVFPNSQVLYFRITAQGLVDGNGNVWYNPERYAATLAQLQQQQQEQRQREANEKLLSSQETKTNSTFSLQSEHGTPTEVVITDVSLKFHCPEQDSPPIAAQDRVILFSQIADIFDLENITTFFQFSVHYKPLEPNTFYTYQQFACISESDTRAVRDAMLNAFNAWKVKFPEEVLH
ncbi:MAG TPA: hypothetical protein VGH42_13065 [Verrucomicrobiae bacterium]|jgi:hypothetical protein